MTRLLLSVLVALVAISIIPTVFSDSIRGEFTIPNWVKNTAGWWADGQIDDSAFLQAIEFLIKEEIITVQIPVVESEVVEGVPVWVKNTAGWWGEDKIHDVAFVGAIKYLIGQGIMTVDEKQVAEELPICSYKIILDYACIVEEVVEVNDFYMEVNGGNCCQNWAYVGEDYKFQIKTFDEYRGNAIDGVTITAKIISKDGELRYDFGQITTVDGFYENAVTILNMDWYAGNTLSVTGEYFGVEKTIEKEFEVFRKQGARSGCGAGTNPFDVSDKDGDMTSITFNSDGSKMFLLGLENDKVHEYKLCKKYSLGAATYTTSFSVPQDASPHGIAFNDDGTKMFIVGQSGGDLNEYALSIAFDISTATFTGNGCTGGASGATGAKGSAINFNADGTKVIVLDKGANEVRESVLSTAYVITSGCTYNSANDSTDLNALSGVSEAKAQGMAFNDDGTKMYIVGEQHDKVYELDLSVAYDVSEETFVASFDIGDQEKVPMGLEFSSDGKTMFVVGKSGDEINVYSLATAWSISTAQHK